MKWFNLFIIDYVLIIFIFNYLFIVIRNRKAIKRYIQLRKEKLMTGNKTNLVALVVAGRL